MCVCVYVCVRVCVCVYLHVRYDSRVKAMELDERPTEQYSDIGGLDKQIEEVEGGVVYTSVFYFLSLILPLSYPPCGLPPCLQLVEAIVLPITHRDRFQNIGIQPPKGPGLYTVNLFNLGMIVC